MVRPAADQVIEHSLRPNDFTSGGHVETIITRLLQDFENGKMSRRQTVMPIRSA